MVALFSMCRASSFVALVQSGSFSEVWDADHVYPAVHSPDEG